MSMPAAVIVKLPFACVALPDRAGPPMSRFCHTLGNVTDWPASPSKAHSQRPNARNEVRSCEWLDLSAMTVTLTHLHPTQRPEPFAENRAIPKDFARFATVAKACHATRPVRRQATCLTPADNAGEAGAATAGELGGTAAAVPGYPAGMLNRRPWSSGSNRTATWTAAYC